jgi:predicted HicB family RNase H-like nuclease
MMEYKGYYARIEYSDEDNCFFGTIAGIADGVSFEGNSPVEIKEAFIKAVEDYCRSYHVQLLWNDCFSNHHSEKKYPA